MVMVKTLDCTTHRNTVFHGIDGMDLDLSPGDPGMPPGLTWAFPSVEKLDDEIAEATELLRRLAGSFTGMPAVKDSLLMLEDMDLLRPRMATFTTLGGMNATVPAPERDGLRPPIGATMVLARRAATV
jgi:hypothetical protein